MVTHCASTQHTLSQVILSPSDVYELPSAFLSTDSLTSRCQGPCHPPWDTAMPILSRPRHSPALNAIIHVPFFNFCTVGLVCVQYTSWLSHWSTMVMACTFHGPDKDFADATDRPQPQLSPWLHGPHRSCRAPGILAPQVFGQLGGVQLG